MFNIFLHSETWFALLTLTFLEIVLGIDNIIFISILISKLPQNKQNKVKNIGLLLAMVFRIALLLSISVIVKLTYPIYTIKSFTFLGMVIPDYPISIRNIILLLGGLFLLIKSTSEVYQKMEMKDKEIKGVEKKKSFKWLEVYIQIILLDMVFSFDSILTAIGLAKEVLIMIIAIIITIGVMIIFTGKISHIIQKHPSLQVLALVFLTLIGFMLITESLGFEIPKGYVYFTIFFTLIVEIINIRMRSKEEKKDN